MVRLIHKLKNSANWLSNKKSSRICGGFLLYEIMLMIITVCSVGMNIYQTNSEIGKTIKNYGNIKYIHGTTFAC
jgi:hypothetical protein